MLLIWVAQGVGFGVLIGNSLVAVVAFLVIPTACMFASATVSRLQGAAHWFELASTTTPLIDGTMQAADWTPLITSVTLWVGLPLVLGCWRLVRREVK